MYQLPNTPDRPSVSSPQRASVLNVIDCGKDKEQVPLLPVTGSSSRQTGSSTGHPSRNKKSGTSGTQDRVSNRTDRASSLQESMSARRPSVPACSILGGGKPRRMVAHNSDVQASFMTASPQLLPFYIRLPFDALGIPIFHRTFV